MQINIQHLPPSQLNPHCQGGMDHCIHFTDKKTEAPGGKALVQVHVAIHRQRRGRNSGFREAEPKSLLNSTNLLTYIESLGFPGDASGKEPACQCRDIKRCRFDPWVGKMPWRRAWQPIPVFLPGESHRQRSLAGYSPWSHKKSDMMAAT